MSGRTQALAVVILAICNAILWTFFLASQRAAVAFDFDAFGAEVRTALPRADFETQKFDAGPMIPDQHVHLLNKVEEQPLLAVYVAYYPVQGLLREPPHDPRVCYQAQGWRVLEVGSSRTLQLGGAQVQVEELVVEKRMPVEAKKPGKTAKTEAVRLRVFHGFLQGGETMPKGVLDQALFRFRRGRSDVTWIRVEFLESAKARQDFDRVKSVLSNVWSATQRRLQP